MHCLIIATGPSLTRHDAARWSRARTVYAVNDAYDWCDPDILYACDEGWWNIHEPKTRHIPERWTTNDAAAKKYDLNHVPGRHYDEAKIYFDTSGHGIIYGGNSGFQALNLAYMRGERDAVLLGFDMGHEPNTPKHCFGEHPASIENHSPFTAWIDYFNKAAPSIRAADMAVRNATPGSRLTCFPDAMVGR